MNIANRVNLGLLPSSEAGWLTACAALRPDRGGVLHVHATVTSKSSKSAPDSTALDATNRQSSMTDSGRCDSSGAASIDRIFPTNTGSAAKSNMAKFAKTRATKPAWSDWADVVCRTLQSHLCGMLRTDWCVSVRHIEHVKSYAPHVDHVVADIDCRPEMSQN